MFEAIGWIGGTLLAVCGIPQAIKTIRDGKCEVSHLFIWAWFLGEVLTLIYILPTGSIPLYLNYSVNVIATSIILFYRLR